MSDNEFQVGNAFVPEELKQLIVMHLEELGKSFDGYFSDKDIQQYPAWVKQPFGFDNNRSHDLLLQYHYNIRLCE